MQKNMNQELKQIHEGILGASNNKRRPRININKAHDSSISSSSFSQSPSSIKQDLERVKKHRKMAFKDGVDII